MTYSTDALANLVRDAEIDPSIYTDPEIFDLEMARIFDRAWLLVGHASQIAEPGSYVTAAAGRHPILILRDQDDTVRAFLNRCPHRGARLCARDRGRTNSFVCPYHGWVFGTDGELKSLPAPEEYGDGFGFGDWGLQPVAALDTYRGFIFVRHSDAGPPLGEFLGEIRTSIDDLVDRAPDGEVEICPVPLRHRFRGNWKLCFENLNDAHHARVAHATSVKAAKRVVAKQGREGRHPSLGILMSNGMPISQFGQLDMVTAPFGHSFIFGFIDGQRKAKVPEAYRQALVDMRGVEEADRVLSVDRHLTLLYPSATIQGRFQTMRLIQPIRHDLTEVVGFLFKLKGAPPEIFEEAMHYFHVSISPFSPVLTDDLELYEGMQVHNASRLARPLPAKRWLDVGDRQERNVEPGTSEAYIRNQYASSKAYMCGAS